MSHPVPFVEAPLSSLPAANHACAAFNRTVPVGTPVIYWPFGLIAPARIGKTRDLAHARQVKEADGRANHRSQPEFVAETYVEGYGGPLSLALVAPITPANMRGHLQIEFTGVVDLDLELSGPHAVGNLSHAVGRAIAPVVQALVPQV